MTENQEPETPELRDWRLKIAEANRNNIFCHCRTCGYEWVASFEDVPCSSCGSKNVEYILCWQFPDD
jgi:rubrerythrin